MRTKMGLLAKFRIMLLLAVLLLPLSACSAPPLWYKAAPIEAWVVDEETGVPLEGVVVVAHWQLKGGLEGGNPVGQMTVMEAVTDSKGWFYFPEWGPKWRPWYGKLKTQAPALLLFKSGYSYSSLSNHLTDKTARGQLENPLRSDWDKKTIKLKKFEGTLVEYERHLDIWHVNLNRFTDFDSPCDWEKIPLLINALFQQNKKFSEAGLPWHPARYALDEHLIAGENYYVSKGCHSPKKFLSEILK